MVTAGQIARYGALGLPLAFVALPLHVQWANVAASQWGLSLSVIGGLLLAVRALDAVVDPWLGRVMDRVLARGRAWTVAAVATIAVALGFAVLFAEPPTLLRQNVGLTLAWAATALVFTYLGYSIAQIVHQAWGARWGGDAVQRARVVAGRESFALVGVVAATVLPAMLGWPALSGLLAALALLALTLLRGAPLPHTAATSPAPTTATAPTRSPWQFAAFRRLMLIYVVSGFAAAVPANLVIFFIRDRLQASGWEPVFLFAYFAAAALSMPLWTRLTGRFGLLRCWAGSMLLATVSFAGAAWLAPGAELWFLAVCIGSGVALGAELIAPAALLAGALQRSGGGYGAEGAWFGWWTFASKFNLAIAAGVALPLVSMLGYTPGARDATAVQALATVYGVLPCVVKIVALGALLWLGRSLESPPARQSHPTSVIDGVSSP
ncbi:MAG: MFS transporter [Burkholderiales bacterium]|nr:MFS transporter [Burkholderiales bacterium]